MLFPRLNAYKEREKDWRLGELFQARRGIAFRCGDNGDLWHNDERSLRKLKFPTLLLDDFHGSLA